MNQADQYSYDAAGDLLSDGQNSYAYDGEGRICAAQSTTAGPGGITGYMYDGEGHRVGKGTLGSLACPSASNPLTLAGVYWLGPDGSVATRNDGTGNWQSTDVFAAGHLLATYDNQGTHFALNDWLGTKRVQANSQGAVEEHCLSLPFGESWKKHRVQLRVSLAKVLYSFHSFG